MKLRLRLLTTAFCLLVALLALAGVPLEVKSLLEGRVELKIPKDFALMSEELARVKYPRGNRPTVIYTDKAAAVNVALGHTQQKATQAQLPACKATMESSFRTAFPKAEWKSSGLKNLNGRQVGYLELFTPSHDGRVYNLMYFTDLDGRLLICTFNCSERLLPNWQVPAREIMNSLKVK